jgi:hypothetical protein
MNFKQFEASRRYRGDLAKHVEVGFIDEIIPGWTYCDDSFYIEYLPDGCRGDSELRYNVTLGNGEYAFRHISQAEVFLWKEFVRDELRAAKHTDGFGITVYKQMDAD